MLALFLCLSRSKMESAHFISLIFIFVLNVFFFFSGVCLNSVVIISFWKSVQLRKKLCYFMIMVLSCCDLLGIVTNTPLVAANAMLLMTKKLDVNAAWPHLAIKLTTIFYFSSLLALFVMNFDRYLATSYPLFHQTSVTKRKLLTFFAILIIIEVSLTAISLNDSIIPFHLYILVVLIFLTPSMLFVNYKLIVVVRKNRRNKGESPKIKKKCSLKNISSCLLAIACFVTLSIPVFVYAGLTFNSTRTRLPLDSNAIQTGTWAVTITSMNSSLNCLIFFWKNKVLRTEGWKVIKSMKIC